MKKTLILVTLLALSVCFMSAQQKLDSSSLVADTVPIPIYNYPTGAPGF